MLVPLTELYPAFANGLAALCRCPRDQLAADKRKLACGTCVHVRGCMGPCAHACMCTRSGMAPTRARIFLLPTWRLGADYPRQTVGPVAHDDHTRVGNAEEARADLDGELGRFEQRISSLVRGENDSLHVRRPAGRVYGLPPRLAACPLPAVVVQLEDVATFREKVRLPRVGWKTCECEECEV